MYARACVCVCERERERVRYNLLDLESNMWSWPQIYNYIDNVCNQEVC
jgi:hypothetical protein